eukprot:CAMPEP_0184990128 /NCGR_PEP_ID=MMETSP1098-20130426/31087_1 /TAXON_ID=89044 /ORGANISM="Spumella elongata, Strain CCAP 955/1" /LENGTH=233 /DNA_ID=CAMNT_0027515263 /DNA_START=30 /DNA_END=731 /DNA_ORIENTATION=-
MSSLSRSLKALQCPFADTFSISDRDHVITLLRWLEDRKIREYDIQERVCLHDSPMWETHLNTYLERLSCPFKLVNGDAVDAVAWLIAYAVSLDYDDSGFDPTHVAETSAASTGVSEKLDNIGSLINVTRTNGETDTEYLARIYQMLKFVLSSNAIESKTVNLGQYLEPGALLENFPLGFDTQDKIVNQVALVMKMLYLSDLRDLQNEVNSLLVLVQEYTANPRLNAALGKVGV